MSAGVGMLSFVQTLRRPSLRWLVVAVTVGIVSLPAIFALFGEPGVKGSGPPAAVIPLGLAALVLQLRHEFAIAAGRRPRGVRWTFLGLACLAYVPMHWFGFVNWATMEGCVMASLPLVLPLRWAVVAAALYALGIGVAGVLVTGPYSAGQAAYTLYALFVSYVIAAGGLYGAARLVLWVEVLRQTQAELAATAVARERVRIARDLHDLLAQSLSAISLKGDLARQLLRSDPGAARREVESVAGLARDTLRGLRTVSQDEHAASLAVEREGVTALLAAAGIDADVSLELSHLPPELERMLAWTIREGVANVLRHSQAHWCSIRGGWRGRGVFLVIRNYGAGEQRVGGRGLVGMWERAAALSGSVGILHEEGEFALRVDLPGAPA